MMNPIEGLEPTPTDVSSFSRRRWLLAAAASLGSFGLQSIVSSKSLLAVPPNIEDEKKGPPCDPEVFEISTRHLGCGVCCIPTQFDLDVHRTTLSGCWSPSNLQQATELEDSERITIIYAHGNWMERENAKNRAKYIAQRLLCRAQRPFRLLMLSWPSQRERRPIHDIKENAFCTHTQAFYLAYVIRHLEAEGAMSLLGYSLGGRIVSGALHLLGGGSIEGKRLGQIWPECAVCDEPGGIHFSHCKSVFRVSFMAPAVERNSMQPGGIHGEAMKCVDRLVNIYNSRDPVLKRFRYLDSGSNPIAAGFAGFIGGGADGNPPSSQPLASQARVYQYDCKSNLGATHDEVSYLTKCPNTTLALDNLLWK